MIWADDTLSEYETIPLVKYVIVEGISSYHPDIEKYYDYKIWIDTPMELSKQRGHARDGSNENADKWDLWAQNDLEYKKKYQPEKRADIVIDNSKENMTEEITEPKQFTHPLLSQAYDSLNALGVDADFWIRETKRLNPKTIIDFGCGTGLLTCELANLGYDVIGIDPAKPMLDIAQTKEHAQKVRWIGGNYTALEGLYCDLILMTSHVAQFLLSDEEWNGMLKHAYESLNEGGYMLFDSRQSISQSFTKWPTKDNPRYVTDPHLGKITYWCNMLEKTDTLATYELHHLFHESGETVVSTDTLIFRQKKAIEKSLIDAGFDIETIYGDWDRSELTGSSLEMLFVVRK